MGFYDWLGDQLAPLFYPGIREAEEAFAKPLSQQTAADRAAISQFEQSYEAMSPQNAPIFNHLADTGERQLKHLERGDYLAFVGEGLKGEAKAVGMAAEDIAGKIGGMDWLGSILWAGAGLIGGTFMGNMVGGGGFISTVLGVMGAAGAFLLKGSYESGELSKTFNSAVSFVTGREPEAAPAQPRPALAPAPG